MWKRRLPLPAITALAVAAIAALTAAQAAPAAAAAAPGWRVVSATNYRPLSIFGSSYGTVVAPGADDAWALGGDDGNTPRGTPVAVHWNGRSWSRAALPSGLSGVVAEASAPSATDIWALAPVNGYLLHFNGKSWSVARRWAQTDGNSPDFSGLTAFSASNVWVFGGVVSGLTQQLGFGTWHWNGRRWTKIGGQGRNIVQASAVSPSDMWAIGGYYEATNQVDHYNGKTWRAVAVPPVMADNERAVYAQSAASVWVDGADGESFAGNPVLIRWNGRTWNRIPVQAPANSLLGMIAGDGHGGINVQDCSRIGNTQCWVLHRASSGTWTRTALAAGTVMFTMAPVPGTSSSWGAGTGYGPYGNDATIWADGPLP